jgi:hypothetical protein
MAKTPAQRRIDRCYFWTFLTYEECVERELDRARTQPCPPFCGDGGINPQRSVMTTGNTTSTDPSPMVMVGMVVLGMALFVGIGYLITTYAD